MNSWGNLLRKSTKDWIYLPLEQDHTLSDAHQGEIESESAYVSVYLKSARLTHVRKGLRKFYGAVHSFMRLPHRTGKAAEFSVVTVPTTLKDVDASSIDRVIQMNQCLMGPVPYVGGELKMEVGLFSIASSDLAAPYLTLLEKLSEKAGVSYVNTALPFVGTIVEGVNLLAGATKGSILEIGLSMTQRPPVRGYFAVIRASKNILNTKGISVDPKDFRLLDEYDNSLLGYSYMVLEIRSDRQREDWCEIPEVVAAYQDFQVAYRRGQISSVEEALSAFRRIVLTCNDLLPMDAKHLVDKVQAMYQDALLPGLADRDRSFYSQPPMPPMLSELDLYGS